MTFSYIRTNNKDLKSKDYFARSHFPNILRRLDFLLKFSFTISETMHGYYLETCDIRVASPFPKPFKSYNLSKGGNICKLWQF